MWNFWGGTKSKLPAHKVIVIVLLRGYRVKSAYYKYDIEGDERCTKGQWVELETLKVLEQEEHYSHILAWIEFPPGYGS